MPKVELTVCDEAIYDLIDKDADLEVVAQGFKFIEGPVWDCKNNCLYFSDIPAGILYKWSEKDGIEKIRDTNKGNGNFMDTEGNLISCEHTASRLVKFNMKTNEVEVLVTHYGDKELNSPNDVVIKSDGVVYFTDPRFGRNPTHVGLERNQELDFQGVFKFNIDTKELVLLDKNFTNPNGLCFSIDEKYLYVNDSPEKLIKRFDVLDDGTLDNMIVWAKTEPIGNGKGVPDGMKIDTNGNIYCCAQGGVHIFNKEGKFLGGINVPEQAGNLGWGENDMQSLYITASTGLYKVKMKATGIQ